MQNRELRKWLIAMLCIIGAFGAYQGVAWAATQLRIYGDPIYLMEWEGGAPAGNRIVYQDTSKRLKRGTLDPADILTTSDELWENPTGQNLKPINTNTKVGLVAQSSSYPALGITDSGVDGVGIHVQKTNADYGIIVEATGGSGFADGGGIYASSVNGYGAVIDKANIGFADFGSWLSPTDPGPPDPDFVRLYAKADERLYYQDSAGTEYGPLDASGGGGSMAIGGTVTSGSDNYVLFNDPAATLAQDAGFQFDNATNTLTLGEVGSGGTGDLKLLGNTSGTATITVPAAAGTPTFTLPTQNRTGLTALPGSTLPLLISSAGAESTGSLTVAQGGSGGTSYTSGSVLFSDGSVFAQDNTNFFWNATSNSQRLQLGAGTSPGEMRLLEGSGGGTNYSAVKSPATLAGNVTHILPVANTAGYWSEDTSGNLVQRTFAAVNSDPTDLTFSVTNGDGVAGASAYNLGLATQVRSMTVQASEAYLPGALGMVIGLGNCYKMGETAAVDAVYFSFQIPDNYSGTTFLVSVWGGATWIGAPGGPGNAYFTCEAAVVADGAIRPAGYGASVQNVTTAFASTIPVKPVSYEKFVFPAITPNGTLTAGDIIVFKFARDSGNAADTTNSDFYWQGCKIEYGVANLTE